MIIDKNRQRFLDVFLEESREHLETMETCLLALEAGGTADSETLNRIFRAAHTIKGGSGMFGFETTARFTHSLENLLDQMRSGQLAMTPPLVDLLLRSCDVVKSVLAAEYSGTTAPPVDQMVEAIDRESGREHAPSANSAPGSGNDSGDDSRGKPEVLAGLDSALARANAREVATVSGDKFHGNGEDSPGPSPAVSGHNRGRVWKMRFKPSSDIFKRGLNPSLAFRELSELGRVFNLKLESDDVPALSTLDPEENYLRWTLQLESHQPEARIREVFEFLHDGEGLELMQEDVPAARPEAQPAAEPQRPAVRPVPLPEAAAPAAALVAESGATIRVDVELLDRLMNQVGELVLARNQIIQFSNTAEDAALIAASQRLNLITSELQEAVMKTRMQPIGVAWSMMPRLVRDLAQSVGKQIQLDMEGAETELDRTIIEAIKDPLTHLVRNSCDHGLESSAQREAKGKPGSGRVLLRAFHEGGHVIIEIADDGQGISIAKVKNKAVERNLITVDHAARMTEREAVHLIFLPGFSTAEKVSGISGRGVGMDVVKTNIERIGGNVDISTRAGLGTTIRIKIPLTLAIIPGMVVEAGGEHFVIPQVSLVELVRLEEGAVHERIDHIHGAAVCRLRGKLLPLAYLSRILGFANDAGAGEDGALSIVVLQSEERQFGLVVDSIRDTQEIVVKPLGKQLKGLNAYSGATVMGDGRVVLILDVPGLAQLAGFAPTAYVGDGRASASQVETHTEQKQALLLFRSAEYECMAVPLALVARLEEIPYSRVEISGGRAVVQYRGRILPLTGLDPRQDVMARRNEGEQKGHLPVVVFLDGDRGVGLVVDEILDIVEESVSVRKESRTPALIGSAVVAGRVTDFLNLRWILESAGESTNGGGAKAQTGTVVVAESSRFNRALLRGVMEMAGHRVIEASNHEELLAQIRQYSVDVVALTADFEQAQGGGSLMTLLRRQSDRPIPVLGIGSGPNVAGNSDFDAHVSSFDGQEITNRLRELMAASWR